jgi:hypothetical protein
MSYILEHDKPNFRLVLTADLEAEWIKFDQVASTDTYKTLRDWFNTCSGAGRISGGGITDDGDGSITVAAMTGKIYTTDSFTGTLEFFDIAETALSLTDNTLNWIYAEYNSGTPQFNVTTDVTTVSGTHEFVVANCYREGTNLYIAEIGQYLSDFVHKVYLHNFLYSGLQRQWGLTTTENATARKLDIAVGALAWAIHDLNIAALSAPTFTLWYNDGSWQQSSVDTVPNTQYNDYGTGLSDLTSNRYGVYWVYIAVNSEVHVVYGVGDYTLAQAELALVPSNVPGVVSNACVLLAKIIVQKSAANFHEILLPWQDVFVGTGATDHGNLAGLGDDDHTQYIKHALSTAANDFLVGSGSNTFVKKTLAETGAILEGDINHANIQGTHNLTTDIDHDQLTNFASNEHFTEASIDHGNILGLGDDDHTQYIKHALSTAANDFLVGSGSNTFVKKTLAETGAILEGDIDHGNLQGIGDDDHTIYALVTGARTFTGKVTIDTTSGGEGLELYHDGNANHYLIFDADRSAAGNVIARIQGEWNSSVVTYIDFLCGADTTNKDEGRMRFATAEAGGTTKVRMFIDEKGEVQIGRNYAATTGIADGGLCIDKHDSSGLVFVLRDSGGNFAHGYTSKAPTDCWYTMQQYSDEDGGVQELCFTDTAANTAWTHYLFHRAGSGDTTKSTAGRGLWEITLNEHDGGGSLAANMLANVNLVAIRSRLSSANVTRWILDEDGDTWQAGNAIVAGKIRIGDSSAPTDELEVHENGHPRIRIIATDANSSAAIKFKNDAQEWQCGTTTGDLFTVYDITGNKTPISIEKNTASNRLYLNDNGFVGIGNTTPEQLLHLEVSDSGACYIHFANTTTGGTNADGFDVGINADEKALIWNRENTDMVFGTNNNTRMTITASGGINMDDLPSGATQVAAGAAADELWVTSGHATLPDNVVMRGV